jgi:glycosyltransferase involved in cell wall biosynthesis
VIVPVKDEEASVAVLATEVQSVLTSTPYTWECLWVNDGSTDGTLRVLQELATRDPRQRWLDLDRNYGQSAAMAAGFAAARGEFFATLDGDGQNDPQDLPQLLTLLEKGDVDMVNGVRQKRQDSVVRKFSSRLANRFRNWLTHEQVTDVGCSLRVFRRECVLGIPVFKGMHRFVPTLVRLRGFRITELPVNHRPRSKGRTKYGINNRLWVGIADTFAVCWMQRRLVQARVRDQSH